jgi:hypothetical protein
MSLLKGFTFVLILAFAAMSADTVGSFLCLAASRRLFQTFCKVSGQRSGGWRNFG